jgi:hypothetical protein
MGLGMWFPDIAFAQDKRMSQIAQEVIEAALQNGTSLYTLEKGYQVRAGLHLPSVVADGESLIWGAIELQDANGKPVQGAVVEIHATAGTIHWIKDHPVTNENGHFIFALQSTLQPTSFRVRFNFPQFGIGGTLPGSFCRMGEPGCFLPGRCADFRVALEYNSVQNDYESLRCTTTVADMYKFYAADSPEPPPLYFRYVTFKNNRPEGAFPERRLYLDYWECNDPYGIHEYCRCLRGSKEGTLDYTYGWNYDIGIADIGMPNGENIAEVTYLQYSSNGAGRICKKEFTFNVSNPLVRLVSSEWIMFTEEEETQSVELEILSPHWRGEMLLFSDFLSISRVNVPERVLEQVRRYDPNRLNQYEFNTAYQVGATLRAGGSLKEVDTTVSFVSMGGISVTPQGYNPQRRTFDFAIRYRLENRHPRYRPRLLVAHGRIDVYFGTLHNLIHSENIGSEYFTEGEHTVIVRIPEDQMTRFGTYHFIPRFTDNFAGYYRDNRPRQVSVGVAPKITTPQIFAVSIFYTVRGGATSSNREELFYPYVGTDIELIPVIICGLSEIHHPEAKVYTRQPSGIYISDVIWSRGEQRPDNNFFLRNVGDLSRYVVWPGPKLEFRWLEVHHHTGERPNRIYWYTLRQIGGNLPTYSFRAERGTKRYAVAVTHQDWDYYLVSGIGKIPKSDWDEYVSGRRKIFARLDRRGGEASAAMRLSVRERFEGSDDNYRLRVVEWATAFIGVRYEWGGCWFGGRVPPTIRDNTRAGYQGFGIDCSKLISAAAMMAGLRWDRRQDDRRQTRRWWDIGTEHLASDSYPYTRGWDDNKQARLNAEPGDILVKRGSHVALIVRFTRREEIRDEQTNEVIDHRIWVDIIDSSGRYDGVSINDGEHLTLPNTRDNPRLRPDTVGDLMERKDESKRTYRLRRLQQLQN